MLRWLRLLDLQLESLRQDQKKNQCSLAIPQIFRRFFPRIVRNRRRNCQQWWWFVIIQQVDGVHFTRNDFADIGGCLLKPRWIRQNWSEWYFHWEPRLEDLKPKCRSYKSGNRPMGANVDGQLEVIDSFGIVILRIIIF